MFYTIFFEINKKFQLKLSYKIKSFSRVKVK